MKSLFLLFIFLISFEGFCQLELDTFPQNFHFYHRDENNIGVVNVKGNFKENGVSKVVLQLFRNDSLKFSVENSSSNFEFNIEIQAILAEYSFKLFSMSSSGLKLLRESNKILCGDAIVLYGQSNMAAYPGIDDFNTKYNDKYMRTYAYEYDTLSTTLKWTPAKIPYAGVGTIGNFMMVKLIDSLKIPIAVINGSIGGVDLNYLSSRNENNHFDTRFKYGQLLNRLKKSGLLNKIKYIAYFQGEAEAGSWYLACNEYPALFKTFQKNLIEDIPNLRKLYQFQIGILGISNSSPYNERAGFLRDFQRNGSIENPEFIVNYSSMNKLPYDGIHYGVSAYENIGKEFSDLILRDFYGSKNVSQIENPNIEYAFYNTTKDSITLVFQKDQLMEFPQDIDYGGYQRRIRDFIYLTSDNNTIYRNQTITPVIAGKGDRNRIKLKLESSRTEKYLTYLPSSFGDIYSNYYNGPHIKNKKSLAAFSFYCQPILDAEPVKPNLIPESPFMFNAVSISANTVNLNWKEKTNNSTYYIYSCSLDGINYAEGYIIKPNVNFHVDNPLIPNQQYFYKLKACNSYGCSDFSKISKTKTHKIFNVNCPDVKIGSITNNVNVNSLGKNVITYHSNTSLVLQPDFTISSSNIVQEVFKAEIRTCN